MSHGKKGLALHARIFIGLIAGTVLGLAGKALFGGDPRLAWFAVNLANPLGQVFLRLVVVYSAALAFIARRSPFKFFSDISEVMMTAFATSSSNVTLPMSLKAAQENLKLPRDISNFVLTIGATANQNGTALYEGVTVLFLAQFFGVDLTLGQQFTVVVMSVLAGVGTAGVPGGSLPLIAVDRLLDMSRAVLNVTGDLAIAACVSALEQNEA